MNKFNNDKPTTLVRSKNYIVITWESILECETPIANYRLQIQNDFKEWKTLYCGKKTQFKVDALAPCTCYNFRINKLKDNSNLDPGIDWLYFKAATEDEGPYCSVMHMSRAVKLGKTPLVRKIAHIRPALLEAENKENRTPLMQAIEMGDCQMLQLLITLGSNVNTPLHHNRKTPLMMAVYDGQIQIAWILVDKGL